MTALNAGPLLSENDDEKTLDPDDADPRTDAPDLPDDTTDDSGWRTAQDASDTMEDGETSDRATGLMALPE